MNSFRIYILDSLEQRLACDNNKNKQQPIFVKTFIYVSRYSRPFHGVIGLILIKYYNYFLQFTGEETEVERLGNIPQATQLVGGEAVFKLCNCRANTFNHFTV